MTKQLPAVNVGADVGKSQLDLYLLERDRALTVPNEEQAIASLIRSLRRYRIERIVIEADRTPKFEPPAMWENEHITVLMAVVNCTAGYHRGVIVGRVWRGS